MLDVLSRALFISSLIAFGTVAVLLVANVYCHKVIVLTFIGGIIFGLLSVLMLVVSLFVKGK